MALTVEDGSGLAAADAYVSLSDVETYFGNTGLEPTTWETLGEVKQEQLVRRATQYLDAKYHMRWKGIKMDETQALDWPRSNVTTRDGYEVSDAALPVTVESACCECAIRFASEEMLPDLTGSEEEKMIKVGPITKSSKYRGTNTKRYPKIDALLMELLKPGYGGGNMRKTRA